MASNSPIPHRPLPPPRVSADSSRLATGSTCQASCLHLETLNRVTISLLDQIAKGDELERKLERETAERQKYQNKASLEIQGGPATISPRICQRSEKQTGFATSSPDGASLPGRPMPITRPRNAGSSTQLTDLRNGVSSQGHALANGQAALNAANAQIAAKNDQIKKLTEHNQNQRLELARIQSRAVISRQNTATRNDIEDTMAGGERLGEKFRRERDIALNRVKELVAHEAAARARGDKYKRQCLQLEDFIRLSSGNIKHLFSEIEAECSQSTIVEGAPLGRIATLVTRAEDLLGLKESGVTKALIPSNERRGDIEEGEITATSAFASAPAGVNMIHPSRTRMLLSEQGPKRNTDDSTSVNAPFKATMSNLVPVSTKRRRIERESPEVTDEPAGRDSRMHDVPDRKTRETGPNGDVTIKKEHDEDFPFSGV